MACEGPSLTESDPRRQESLADPDDWPAADPGPGLSLQGTSAVSLQRAPMPATTDKNIYSSAWQPRKSRATIGVSYTVSKTLLKKLYFSQEKQVNEVKIVFLVVVFLFVFYSR